MRSRRISQSAPCFARCVDTAFRTQLHPAVGVGEHPLLLGEAGSRQHHVGIAAALVQEDVLDDQEVDARSIASSTLPTFGSEMTMSSPMRKMPWRSRRSPWPSSSRSGSGRGSVALRASPSALSELLGGSLGSSDRLVARVKDWSGAGSRSPPGRCSGRAADSCPPERLRRGGRSSAPGSKARRRCPCPWCAR